MNIKLLTLICASTLTACSGGGAGSDFTPSAGNNLGAIAASGAPLPNVPYTVTRLNGQVVTSGTVGTNAYLQTAISAKDAPFIVKVTDTGVTPNVDYENLVLPSDFDSNGKVNLNITPISTIVTKIVKGQFGSNLSTASASDLIS